MKRLLVLAAGAAVFAAALAWAQPLVPTSWSGNEVFEVALGGPGGSAAYITMAQVRNATAALVTNVTTGPLQMTNLQNRIIFGAALTGGVALTTPTNPYDGEMTEAINGTGGTFTSAVTLTPSGSQTVATGASSGNLATGASAEWQYVAVTNSWYRIR